MGVLRVLDSHKVLPEVLQCELESVVDVFQFIRDVGVLTLDVILSLWENKFLSLERLTRLLQSVFQDDCVKREDDEEDAQVFFLA